MGARASESVGEALRRADLVVVGAGLTGLTIAERVWNGLGRRVVVVDKRGHPGGNAWSYDDDETGIEVHQYGTHIFHTSNRRVWDYVNRFSDFNDYRHTVWSMHRGQRYSLPVNLATMSQLAGRALAPWAAREWVDAHRRFTIHGDDNLEARAVNEVGTRIYEALIEGYTWKQWGMHPRELPAEVIARLPVRYNLDNHYFNDTWEGLPLGGYHHLIDNLSSWRGVSVRLGVNWFEVSHEVTWPVPRCPVVYTGPVDAFFGHRHGRLNWRTVDLELETLDTGNYQGAAVVNEADVEVPYTRTHEFRHLHPERDRPTPGQRAQSDEKTVIAREYSRAAGRDDEPYYPVNSAADRAVLKRYRAEAARLPNVLFAGRLGTYKYLDMHMAIAGALSLVDNVLEPHFLRGEPLKKRGESGGEGEERA